VEVVVDILYLYTLAKNEIAIVFVDEKMLRTHDLDGMKGL
jgi:hypothetical protein